MFNHSIMPVFWLVGLSGCGKTTLAKMLASHLEGLNCQVEHVDGDEFRKQFNFSGFSREARFRNINAMREHVLSQQAMNKTIIVSAITPYAAMRERNSLEIPQYNEIWIKCPVNELERRDTKGLYAQASNGSLADLSGVGDDFDMPENASLTIDTSMECQENSFKRLRDFALARLSSHFPAPNINIDTPQPFNCAASVKQMA